MKAYFEGESPVSFFWYHKGIRVDPCYGEEGFFRYEQYVLWM